MGKKRIGHYEIIAKISEGGMGAVYKARDVHIGRIVAIKIIPPRVKDEVIRQKLKSEAISLSRLSHPNIATLYEYNTQGRLEYLVMEYVEGRSLSSILKERRLSFDEVVDYAFQIGEALKEAHSKGIVHRDIKPSNVMIDRYRKVKVIDFGIASFFEGEASKTYHRLGTLGYVAPEVIVRGEVTPKSDIFSFGVLLYRMITGKKPYPTGLYYDKDMNFVPPPEIEMEEVPEAFKSLVMAMLREKPEERPDIYKICKILEGFQQEKTSWGGEDISSPSESKRRISLKISLPVAFLVIVTLVFLFFPKKPRHILITMAPFQNRTAKVENNFIAFGLPAEVKRRLSVTRKFVFISYSEVEDLVKKGFSQEKAALKSGAKWLIEGEIFGEKSLSLTITLKDLRKGKVYKETFPLVRKELQNLVRDISLRITKWTGLKVKLKKVSVNPQAYELYLKGIYKTKDLSQIQSRAFEQAKQYIDAALSIEQRPEYFLALSKLYFGLINRGIEINEENYRLCRYYLKRGLELDPQDPSLRTWETFLDIAFRQPDTLTALQKGSEEILRGNLNPKIGIGMGVLLRSTGNFPLAERIFRYYGEVFPENAIIKLQLSWTLFQAGKRRKAIETLEGLLLYHRDLTWGKILLAKFLISEGNTLRAKSLLRDLPDIVPVRLLKYQLENFPVRRRKFEPPEAVLKTLSFSEDQSLWVAECYSISGNQEKALKYLKLATDRGYLVWNYFAQDPLLKNLRQMPEYEKMSRAGMMEIRRIWEKEEEILKPVMKKLGI